jgi:putative thiamine transport system permease protein
MLIIIGPVAAGLFGTVFPAFGYLPATGLYDPSVAPFSRLFEWPGIGSAIRLSLTTGVLATLISLFIVTLITAGWWGTATFVRLERALSPLLAMPHAAAAFGLAFLIAPSGWIVRIFSPWATGWEQPPDLLILQDGRGLALVAGLVIKEVPFLLLMSLAALGQADPHRRMTVARALGYRRISGWLKTVFPRIYAQIRLPVYVVLAYSMTVVDVAVILGPTTPSTLSVMIIEWMSSPDLSMRSVAAAGALLQLGLVLAMFAVWYLIELAMAWLGRKWITRGGRGHADRPLRMIGLALGAASAAAVFLGLLMLALWSVSGFWGFPDLFPDKFTWQNWMKHGPGASAALGETVLVALTATVGALILVLGCLEAEYRHGLQLGSRGLWLLYLPLLIPQTAFLPGLQTLLLLLGADKGRLPVILAHLVFVLPYVFLSLGDPFRAWDARQGVVARALGAGADRVLWKVRLPMLLRPVLTAVAVGLSVSVGQYLPTLLIGGGRVATITTEAVALASGGDRRAIGVYGLVQTGAALMPFALALLIPTLIWRNRRGMQHG